MNRITFKHPKVNNDEDTYFFTAASKEDTEVQIAEVLVGEHYKRGRVKKDMTVIDCGANIGLASIFFKDWAKEIYALEPSSRNYECLVENTKQYENIKPFQVGLAARTSYEWLKTNNGNPIAESLFGNGSPIEHVKLFSIEDFMNEQKIEHVDLLKMDTEGAEYLVFPSTAFGKVAHKIDYIVGEAHYFGTLVPDFLPMVLDRQGFDLEWEPINNMWLSLDWDEGDENKQHHRVDKNTIFFAKRKDLPWPN